MVFNLINLCMFNVFMITIGDKNKFAFEIAEQPLGNPTTDREIFNQLRQVDIYIAGRSVCCDDNHVYVSQFVNSLWHTAEYLKQKLDYYVEEDFFFGKSIEEAYKLIQQLRDLELKIISKHWVDNFLDWGPTTDNIICLLFPLHGKLYMIFEFCRDTHKPTKEIGKVFAVEIFPYEIITVCESAIGVLDIEKSFLGDKKNKRFIK